MPSGKRARTKRPGPVSASFTRSGASAGNRNGACTTAAGKFGWELINEDRNLYRTWGKVQLTNRPANCTSDVTAGVLQRPEAVSGGKWRFYAAVARGETGSFWLDDTGVSNVRFRICNVRSGGIIDGCGRVQ
ncbi:hypothetical protein [Streptomyces capitiformicae]|uniref:Uncharacterized protein n=1 Tax=Streptomyces capitiformicae TaxID=2014920 RepID=A0A919GR20_9ACTN|nr:hypothetical protein [Streptomyces capitiformicae]GHH89061.1 hypothetical protein GCM10017771_37200 [Streptomyces capitiformicae]